MKFINKKYKGFTLSELMIMLAVLTVLLAAFAPVFTVRYNNATSENVWAFVQDDEEQDAYTDQVNKVMPAQLFVGITPANMSEVVLKAVSDGSNTLYSKFVIRPTDQLTGTERAQKQIQFRYGSTNTGDAVGALFAGNENILLGGNYVNITTASGNTAYGKGALNSIKTGNRNSAIGFNALNSITTASDTTAIGALSGENINNSGNTLIGYNTSSNGNYVTVISDNLLDTLPKRGDYSTVIGTNAGKNIGNSNVIVGYNAGSGNSLGANNTAVGNNALSVAAGSNNTAIGYNACSGVTGSNKTCIGYNSGISTRGDSANSNILSDGHERVLIGSTPIIDTAAGAGQVGGAAVLEVHNINSRNNSLAPVSGGDASVVVNGNLIVRGQLFKSSRSRLRTRYSGAEPSLIGFRETKPKKLWQHARVIAAYDGQERDWEIHEGCRGCRRHSYSSGMSNCTCAIRSVSSYDWTTPGNGVTLKGWHNGEPTGDRNDCMNYYGSEYTDKTTGFHYKGYHNDINMAHRTDGKTCCPDLRSDIRLKNVSGKFTGGLDEIRNLMIYNYTYKSDEVKNPHVGVIAQDLKRVFPTAVKKDENGYYQIRWDEMFYAAINAIKTLNTKVEQLASRVSKDQVRIANLKKDNAQLEKQLETLSAELTLLEKTHK